MSKYLFDISVVVPTRNRIHTLSRLVNLFKSVNLPRVQLVIQDNSDTEEADSYFSSLDLQQNIKLSRIRGDVSFVDNFSFGAKNSDGEYLIFIGDDDAVLPSLLDAYSFAKSKNADCIVSKLSVVYFWPNSLPREGYETGRMVVSKFRKGYFKKNIKREFIKLLKNGCLDYLYYFLPKAYHGLVKKETLLKIEDKIGDIFVGLTPDISVCTSLCLLEANTYFARFPFTISGISKNSGSGDSGTSRHQGKLSSAPHFKGHTDYFWEKEIPDFYSVETIWAETIVKTVKMMGFGKILDVFFNKKPLLITCYCKYRELYCESSFGNVTFFNKKPPLSIRSFFTKVREKLLPKYVQTELGSIEDAEIQFEKYISKC